MYIVYFTQPDKYPATKNISLYYKLKCTVNFTFFCLMCIVYFNQPEEYPATQIRSYFCSLMYHTYLKPCLAHNHHSIKAHIDFVPCCLTSGPVFPSFSTKRLSMSLCTAWLWQGSAMVIPTGSWPRRTLTWLRVIFSWKVSLPQAAEGQPVGFCFFARLGLTLGGSGFLGCSLHTLRSHFLSQSVRFSNIIGKKEKILELQSFIFYDLKNSS